MPGLFQIFRPQALEVPFPSLSINGHQIEYLAFANPDTAHLPPVLVLPGVFQDFSSLFFNARRLLKSRPVILMALPGQGANPQLAPGMSLQELAGLPAGFLESTGIKTVTPLAFSYGAAVAYVFCALYPHLTEKAILGGLFHQIHTPFRDFLVQARELLHRKNMPGFATHLTRNMINQQAREQTGISELFQNSFHRYLRELPEIEQKRYLQNINRLIEIDVLPGKPETETLFYAGRQDNFARPAWVRQTSRMLNRAHFALIEGADHMVTTARKEVLNRLFTRYISDEKLENIEGVTFEPPTPAANKTA